MTVGDPFPPAPRVHYQSAPLVQVVCQVRYPTILRIDSEAPAQFQEAIRHTFPLLERSVFPLPHMPDDVVQALGSKLPPLGWTFLTENRSATIGLASDSMSLTVATYDRWESFRSLFLLPLQALRSVYQPAFFSRIGVRYIDLIIRSKLNLSDQPWSTLLRREILGELAYPEIEANLLDVRRMLRLRVPSMHATIMLQHGLAAMAESTEPAYMIDLDFSSETRTEIGDVEASLDGLNGGVGRAFRWCISDLLHEALVPSAILSGANT